jgi:NADPH2:quinone reductase
MIEAMRYIDIDKNGQLIISTMPVSIPTADEILIKVSGTGLNRADLLQKRGLYPPPYGASPILGLEVSGVHTITNERICGLLSGGGYAEYVSLHKLLCLPVPDHLDLINAAGLPEAIYTVYRNLIEIGGMKKEDHVLIHGGASGIGTMAIQIAKLYGARVTITAGDDIRCQKSIDLGAHRAINYRTTKFEDVLRDDPVDLVLDMVGGTTLTRTIPIMNKNGRIVSIAYMESAKTEISIPHIMKKRLTITGSTLRDQSLEYKIALTENIKRDIWPHVISGRITPVIDRVFDFDHVQQAHDYFETGGHFGKILLKNG